MASQNDVRRIALALPGVSESTDRFAFHVASKGKPKSFVWSWLERLDPKKARVASSEVIAVRVRDQGEKADLLAGSPDKLFTEPHYNGFPAVLVRLRAVTVGELRALVTEAWRCQVPRELRDEAAAGGARAARAATVPVTAAKARAAPAKAAPAKAAKAAPAKAAPAKAKAKTASAKAAKAAKAAPAKAVAPKASPATAKTGDAATPDAAFAPVAAAFAGAPGITAGKMMASFGLKVDGKIFAMSVGGALVVKMPRARVDALVAAGTGSRFDPRGGRPMKEWVAIAPGAAPWLPLAREAHRFVSAG